MDGERFDHVVRSLAGGSRRRLLRSLAAGALSGLPALLRQEAAASCRGKGKRCEKGKQCCSGDCRKKKCLCGDKGATCRRNRDCCDLSCKNDRCCLPAEYPCSGGADCCSGTCCGRTCCGDGQACDNGTCKCSPAFSPCGDFGCCDEELVGEHCCNGRCCAKNQKCANGRCVDCPEGQVACGDQCTAPCDASQCQTCDPENGACVSTCAEYSNASCCHGHCSSGGCCPDGEPRADFGVCCGDYGRPTIFDPSGHPWCACSAGQLGCFCRQSGGGRWQLHCHTGGSGTCHSSCVPA